MGYAIIAAVSGALGGIAYQWVKARWQGPHGFRCKHGDLTFHTNNRKTGVAILTDHIARFHPEDIHHIDLDLER